MPSAARGYATALAVAATIVLISTLTVWGGASTPDVGEYLHDGETHDLTDDHITDTTEGFVVDAPDAASEIRVNPDYVDSRLDDFDVDHAYDTRDGRLVIVDDDATFTDFAASDDTAFTRGSSDAIRFAERPMWLSVDTSGQDAVTFEAHDATNDGQPIRVDASWLEAHGVEGEPIAYYHDGTTIPVEATADGTAYVVDAPHFSHITLGMVAFDTSWQTEGHTRELFVDGPSGQVSEFNITVSEVTPGHVEFRFWSVQNGSQNVFDGDETFEKVGRDSLDRSGYYTFNFVNETNLQTGYAMLGDERFHLVEVNAKWQTYDFSDGDITYRYDQATGYLERVYDARNGARISLQETRIDEVPAVAAGHLFSVYHEANLTDRPMYVAAEWVDGEPDAKVLGPYWSGSSEDEVIQANILSDKTAVRAIAGVEEWAELDGHLNDTLCSHDCYPTLDTRQFHVHWDPAGDTSTDDSWGRELHTLTEETYSDTSWPEHLGYIHHDEGLLGEGEAPFWLCGHAKVTHNGTVVKHKDHIHGNKDLCPDDDASENHPHDVEVMGWITTDPFHDL